MWFGNDDYSPLDRMTGGSLHALTWHEIMAYAHQGVELKQIAGVGPNSATVGPMLDKEGGKDVPIKPAMLTNKGVEALLRVERLMDEASRAMVAATGAAPPPAASTQQPPRVPGRADNRIGSVAANGN